MAKVRPHVPCFFWFVLAMAVSAGRGEAQTPRALQTTLTLAQAVARAEAQNVDLRAADMAERQARERVSQARAASLPSVNLSESIQRGNQPVFVFGSLLAQRQFTPANFAIDALNRPGALNNVRVGMTLDQSLFDPVTRSAVRAAALEQDVAATSREAMSRTLALDVTTAYGAVLSAEAATRAAEAAVVSAEADLERTRNRRDAGLVTDADVLQIEVHLARARRQEVRARADASVARSRLNALLGEPLDTLFLLQAPLPEEMDVSGLAPLEAEAVAQRADVKQAVLREQIAGVAVDAARRVFLPTVRAQLGWEANGGGWTSRASSWTVGATASVNLFRGFADRSRVAEARHAQSQRALERQSAEVAARVDVRVAVARFEAARASEVLSRTAVAQARESQRIVRDRYESGLADVTALLRASEYVQQAEADEAEARVEVSVAYATLTRALGRR